jgi:hypothetical protein
MMTDPDVQRELEANKQRAREINESEDNRPADDPASRIDDAYQAFVDPPLLNDELDPQEAERRAIENDEAARSD